MDLVLPLPAPSVVFEDVSWEEYLQILDALAEFPGHRVAYDRGRLEIVSPTQDHERLNRLLGRFVETLADVLGIGILGFGCWTIKRKDLRRGTEPDSCYYIQNTEKVRGKKVDLLHDPPPDLGIEVDVTRKSLDRFPLYGAFRVPEIWRHYRGQLVFSVLDPSGEYVKADESRAFPGLRPADLVTFLERRHELDDTQLAREFRKWARGRFGKGDMLHLHCV
jgi:Uma2 family endonuclease